MTPGIISCLIPMLLHLGSSSFSSHASALCHLAALDQDAIGFLDAWWAAYLYPGIQFRLLIMLHDTVNVWLHFGQSIFAISYYSLLIPCGAPAMTKSWQLACLWLQAVHDACIHGQEQLQSFMGGMHQLMDNWVLPPLPPS